MSEEEDNQKSTINESVLQTEGITVRLPENRPLKEVSFTLATVSNMTLSHSFMAALKPSQRDAETQCESEMPKSVEDGKFAIEQCIRVVNLN